MISVSAIYYYPIKSCKGIGLDPVEIGPRGIRGDREFMLVDAQGTFITQRDLPEMALIRPAWEDQDLIFSAPGVRAIRHTPDFSGQERMVEIWQDRCTGIDQGDEISQWFSDFLGKYCRLVRFSADHPRLVDPVFRHNNEDQIAFADGYPFLMISESSLADLNQRMGITLPVDRFRPNILISGSEPYAEDRWRWIQIGEIEFLVAKPCARCVITTVDQEKALSGQEPLRTLAGYRKSAGGKVLFGQNLIHRHTGRIKVGDPVTVISR